jgi:hypothetical protein
MKFGVYERRVMLWTLSCGATSSIVGIPIIFVAMKYNATSRGF